MKWKIASFSAALLWLLCICLGIMFSSCSSTRIVTVPEYHEVVVHQRDTTSVRDSVYVHDSVFVELRGDTVVKKEYHIVYKDRWRDRLRVDSFVQRDTVTVVKEVEKPPNWWQQKKQQLGTLFLLLLVGAMAYFIVRIIINRYIKPWK